MKYSNTITDKFLTSSFLASSLFVTSGCYKTYKDYKNAPKEYKDKFLVKDSLILSGAALGMLGCQSVSNKILKSKIYDSALLRISQRLNPTVFIKHTAGILKELSEGVMTSASGIAGALTMDYLYSKCNSDTPEYVLSTQEKNNITALLDKNIAKVTDKETREALYTSISDLPVISSGMLGANALEIAKNKEFNTRLKYTTGYLINDTLVPLLFLSVSSALTKNMKPQQRIPLVFLSLFAGTLATRKIVDKFVNNKIKLSMNYLFHLPVLGSKPPVKSIAS